MKVKQKDIEQGLRDQLERQNKFGKYFDDMINDYISLWKLKKKLVSDITKKGLRIETINGNGISSEKPNESIINLLKVNNSMLKILSELGLQNVAEVKEEESSADGYT